MEHELISAVERALGWNGPEGLGRAFARGTLADVSLVERLLTPNKLLDLVMRRSLSNPQVRLFHDGKELHPREYFSHEVARRGHTVQTVNMLRLGHRLRDGATLVLDQANVFDPTMEVACRALQWWSRELVQVNIYLTTNGASGFNLHWDDHDVLVVQLAGEKDWEVRGASRTAPLFRDAARNDEPSEDVEWAGTMRTGDVMHIPRGHWHQATRAGRSTGQSLHMTFGFAKRTGVNWLSWLADWSREQEVFRHDLDRWGSPQDQAAQYSRLNDAAVELLRTRGPEQFLAAREQEAVTPRHVPYISAFGPLHSAVCVTAFRPQLLERGSTVDVVAAGKHLTFAVKALPALRVLLSGHPVDLAQAAAVVGTEVEQVADILVREELCATLTDELSSGYTGLVTNAGS